MFTLGNSKLKKDNIASYALPAIKTCPSAGVCKQYCYGKSGNYCYPKVKQCHENNLQAIRNRTFSSLAWSSAFRLKSKGVTHYRLNSSGDIFSNAYLKDIIYLAKNHPSLTFYAYTKEIRRIKAYKGIIPSNLFFIYSLGGVDDHLIDMKKDRHAKIFNDEKSLKKAGYANASKSDLVALGKNKRISLIAHGAVAKFREAVK